MSRRSRSPTPRQSAIGPLSCRRPIGWAAPPSVTDLPAILPELAHIADTPSSSAIALMRRSNESDGCRAQRLVFDAARALRLAAEAVKAAEEAVEESESVASILPTVRSLSSHERATFIVHFQNTFREGRKTLRAAVMQPQAQQQSL